MKNGTDGVCMIGSFVRRNDKSYLTHKGNNSPLQITVFNFLKIRKYHNNILEYIILPKITKNVYDLLFEILF